MANTHSDSTFRAILCGTLEDEFRYQDFVRNVTNYEHVIHLLSSFVFRFLLLSLSWPAHLRVHTWDSASPPLFGFLYPIPYSFKLPSNLKPIKYQHHAILFLCRMKFDSGDLAICYTCGTQFDVPYSTPPKSCRICDVRPHSPHLHLLMTSRVNAHAPYLPSP